MCVSDNLVYLELQSSEIPYFPDTNLRDSTKIFLFMYECQLIRPKARGGDF